jgi:hypothetical protein
MTFIVLRYTTLQSIGPATLSTTQTVEIEIPPHGDEEQNQQGEQKHRLRGGLLRHEQILTGAE